VTSRIEASEVVTVCMSSSRWLEFYLTPPQVMVSACGLKEGALDLTLVVRFSRGSHA
jgi:hypothetical protein